MNTPGIVPARPGSEATRQDVWPTQNDAFAEELAAAIETTPAETENPDTGTGDVLPPDEPGSPHPESPTPPVAPSTPATDPGGVKESNSNHDARSSSTIPTEPVLIATAGQSAPDGTHVLRHGTADDPAASREPARPPARDGAQRSLGGWLEPPVSLAPEIAGFPASDPLRIPPEGAPNSPLVTPIIPATTSPSPSVDPVGSPKETPVPLPPRSDGAETGEALERFDSFARVTRSQDGRAEVNLGGRDGIFTVSVRPDAGEVFLTARLTSRSLLEAFDASAQELADALSRHGLDLTGFDTGPHEDRQPPTAEHEFGQDPADPDVPFTDSWRRSKIVA